MNVADPFYSYQGMEAFPGPSGHVPATQNPVEETAPDPEPPGLTSLFTSKNQNSLDFRPIVKSRLSPQLTRGNWG